MKSFDYGKYKLLIEDDFDFYGGDGKLKKHNSHKDLKNNIRQLNYNNQIMWESCVMSCFLRKPVLLEYYDLSLDKLTNVGLVFYSIILGLYSKGYKELGNLSIPSIIKESYFSDGFKILEGYSIMVEYSNSVSVGDIDYYIENMTKYYLFRKFDKFGFDIFKEYHNLDKLSYVDILNHFERDLKKATSCNY